MDNIAMQNFSAKTSATSLSDNEGKRVLNDSKPNVSTNENSVRPLSPKNDTSGVLKAELRERNTALGMNSINQEFECDSAKRLEDILLHFKEKISKAENFNKEAYTSSLEIFRVEGNHICSWIEELMWKKYHQSYDPGNLICYIAYVIDNSPADSPYFDKEFFTKMLVPLLDYRNAPELFDLNVLSCYVAGRFILNIGGKEPLSCPENNRDDFFSYIKDRTNAPAINFEIRSILRELSVQAIMHCEMPELRRVNIMLCAIFIWAYLNFAAK